MTPTTCDHGACNARALVYAAFDAGGLAFCCHHWNTLHARAADEARAVLVEPGCRMRDEPTSRDGGTTRRIDDGPIALAC